MDQLRAVLLRIIQSFELYQMTEQLKQLFEKLDSVLLTEVAQGSFLIVTILLRRRSRSCYSLACTLLRLQQQVVDTAGT